MHGRGMAIRDVVEAPEIGEEKIENCTAQVMVDEGDDEAACPAAWEEYVVNEEVRCAWRPRKGKERACEVF